LAYRKKQGGNINRVKTEWKRKSENLQVTASPSQAHQQSKVVDSWIGERTVFSAASSPLKNAGKRKSGVENDDSHSKSDEQLFEAQYKKFSKYVFYSFFQHMVNSCFL
jgi:hypothetical protein